MSRSERHSGVPLKLLILGGGAVVRELYLPALDMLHLIAGTAVVDTCKSSLASIKDKYPGVDTRQADYRDILSRVGNRSEFNAVLVALPNFLHEAAVVEALELGFHVLCEKPLALSPDVCHRLEECARSHRRVLSVNMVWRLRPSIAAAREALAKGLIGKLTSVDIEDGSPYAWPVESGAPFMRENGGVLADIGVHYLDLLEVVVGRLSPSSYWDDSRGGVEANVEFRLTAKDRVQVRMALSRTRNLRNSIILTGTDGELHVEQEVYDSCRWRPNNAPLTAKLFPVRSFDKPGLPQTLESCFAQQLLNFSTSIQSAVPDAGATVRASSTMSLIEWAYEQPRSSGQIAAVAGDISLPVGAAYVTGGTGFIGGRLIERISEHGFTHITVPVRHYGPGCAEASRFPVDAQRVNLLDYDEVRQSMRGARWAFHLAYGRDGLDAKQVTVEGTKNVVEAAIAEGCESVVVLSTAVVFGYPKNATVDEGWPYRPAGGAYGTSKAQMEKWCLRRSRSSHGTRIVVLNPSCVFGPGGKTYTEMPARLTRDEAFCWIAEGRGNANYTFVSNLVDAMLLAANCPQADGQRFIINDGAATWRSFLSPILGGRGEELRSYTKEELLLLHKQNGRPGLVDVLRSVAGTPAVVDLFKSTLLISKAIDFARRWTPGMLQKARDFRGSAGARNTAEDTDILPPVWLADLFGPNSTVFSSEKARSMLGWEPRVSLEEGQQESILWLKYFGVR